MPLLYERDLYLKGPAALRKLDVSSLDFDKQNIIHLFPGDLVSSYRDADIDRHARTDDQMSIEHQRKIQEPEFQKMANGMLKMVHRMLGGYDNLSSDKNRVVLNAYQSFGQHKKDLLDMKYSINHFLIYIFI